MNDDFPIRVTQRAAVAVWTLDRPGRMNALSRGALLAIGNLVREVETNPSVRAVVLTGSGHRAFCAGADLKERLAMSPDGVRALLDLYRTELGALDRASKPIVAAVNGVALGGGLELALCCDLRIAAPDAVFGLPETSLGIIPGAGGTQRLPRVIGEARTKELVLLGRRLSAAQALSWGLVNHVAASGESLLDEALEWIAPIGEGAPIAQSAALESIDRALDVPLDVGLVLERACYERTLLSEDRAEALAAFAEKRKPVFRGT